MDISRLRRGELIAGAAGIVLLIDLWLKWYGLKVEGVSGIPGDFGGSFNAWESFGIIDLILFLTIVVAVGSAVLTATQRSVALPVAASVVVTALGALATLLVLYRIIDPPGASGSFGGVEVGLSRGFGLFLGVILTGAITYGGFASMQEEGTSFGEAADSLKSGGGGTPPAAPPPPPAPPTGSAPPPGP
jgi:hypothetical protein